ncbi:MAG: recombination regulator RecX [Bacillales bacterium]|jgi:regulatory protein|nr:recombination regulator RecX [Bacillales bacterium]
MIVITKIEVQKNSKDRFNIYIDKGNGEEFGFGVDSYVLANHQLTKGKVIDDLDLEEIIYSDSIRKAYNKAINYLSSKKRTTKEIRSKLQDDDYSISVIDEVLNKLISQKYINDGDYSDSFVRTQMKISKIGPRNIARELKDLGIDESTINKSIQTYYSTSEQLHNAQYHLSKYNKKYSKLSYKDKKEKTKVALMLKGFSIDIIESILKEININEDDNNNALIYNLNKYMRKYSNFEEKEKNLKIKQALYRKGFNLNEIEEALNNIEVQ